MNWQEIFGNWVLMPRRPIGVIHFLGGAFVAAAPHLTYRRLLEFLHDQGYVIIATPFINTFDHEEIAETVLWSFNRALQVLHDRQNLARNLPIYGMGHSMGCKLHLLIGSLFESVERSGNMLLSFNNFAAKEAIPFMEQMSTVPMLNQFSSTMPLTEFVPSPEETNRIITKQYLVQRNLLIKFANDNLDQSLSLARLLEDIAPGMITTQRLRGNHLTPLGQGMKFQMGGAFSSIDAVGNLFQQEFFKELAQVEQTIIRWLNPAPPANLAQPDW
ncbi:DUF1350 family protein [filamentous cyanobacterium LEGE 11480]|uniref:DUF1350 family protein n=1 Tax=Romeriopsis navalis LEGE 11480 TaxID=2777977 RepID=A0A928VQ99_9CYAN|nr:DUF1350 family protein [Romeriopsis navalis]MBE9030941.1 DUF1350 family protein [Romeriopsis navalis LEGE 11480]